MRYLSMMLWVAMWVMPAMAADKSEALLQEISQQLAKQGNLQVDFVQTKQMAALKKPLVMKGALLYNQADGIVWQLTSPYRVRYEFNGQAMIETNAAGERRERKAEDSPAIAQISNIFKAILSADQALLAQHFQMTALGSIQKWEMHLTPKAAYLRKAMTEIVMTGNQTVETVQIDEANGDRTDIRFLNRAGAGVPTQNTSGSGQ
ncbi:MAG: LolA family protein [Methylophilus sp.]|uniref:LolA family protein n=1 Tax=Methylophilus sp. TaxID=29541 RepID=UPI003F9EE445